MASCSGDFCREVTLAASAPTFGTATASTSVWLLLEVRESWEAKAYESAALPTPIRAHIDGWLRDIPGARVQFIRRQGAKHASCNPLSFMIGWTGQERPGVARFELETGADLLAIDAPAVLADLKTGAAGDALERPLIFVCTHGKRDRCCAKWGLPVYQRLDLDHAVEVWQTSHLGGHRFAATVLTLPYGLHYGHFDPEDAKALVEAEAERRILVSPGRSTRLRGRTCLSTPEQVVDHHIRERTGCWGVDEVKIVSHSGSKERVEISAEVGRGEVWRGCVRREISPFELLPSCGKAPERSSQWTLEWLEAAP